MTIENNVPVFVTHEKKSLTPLQKKFSTVMLLFEDLVKVPVFKCQKCGECLLSHTGFTCSQRCPKRSRNGPCGGTREGGYCEVYPDRRCIWYLIHKRARLLGRASLLESIEKAHNWNLEKSSAWYNVFTRRIDPPTLFIRKKKHHDAER